MKKLIIPLSICLIALTFFQSEARVWRLNNQSGVDADVNGTLQDAVDTASSGDTIYIEPSSFSYGGATIEKKLIIIGPGYWLSENDSTQAIKDTSHVGELIFNSGSQGSVISGLYSYSSANIWYLELIEINTDNITIQRCYIELENYSYPGTTVVINGNRSGIIIQQNWIANYDNANACIEINGDPGNLIIRNNFLWGRGQWSYTEMSINASTNSSSNFVIKNNILYGGVKTYSALYFNNILLTGTYSNGTGGVASNNICNGTQFPTGNSNQQNVTMSNIFVDHDLYIDNGYKLAVSSSAKNAGITGGDCGMFSDDYGGEPYILSGIPDIPSIFDVNFNATVISTNTLNVTIKAKSNK